MLNDSVWSLHEGAGEKSFPMLQITHHILNLDDSIANIDTLLLVIRVQFKLTHVYFAVIKVHPCTIGLNQTHNFELRDPCHISVVLFIHGQIFFMELLRVFHCHYQI